MPIYPWQDDCLHVIPWHGIPIAIKAYTNLYVRGISTVHAEKDLFGAHAHSASRSAESMTSRSVCMLKSVAATSSAHLLSSALIASLFSTPPFL